MLDDCVISSSNVVRDLGILVKFHEHTLSVPARANHLGIIIKFFENMSYGMLLNL